MFFQAPPQVIVTLSKALIFVFITVYNNMIIYIYLGIRSYTLFLVDYVVYHLLEMSLRKSSSRPKRLIS